MSDSIRRAIGAIVGAGVGTFAYWLLLIRGYHILAAVGAGVALGVSAMARTKQIAWGVATGVLAVLLSVLVESLFRPFAADESFSYFISHLHDLPRNSLISLAVVAALGVYFGRGRVRGRVDSAQLDAAVDEFSDSMQE